MSVFQPFDMERMMSLFEQDVEFNLSESGVHPITVRELLELKPESTSFLLESDLNYPHVNGIPELRDNIAAMYEGADPENVLVTVGAAEANYISTRTLLNSGDEIVIMMPNYMQIWGIAKNHGLKIRTFHLDENQGWSPDLDELEDAVSPNTKLIAVCSPNNPTGSILARSEMASIVNIADSVGAWILADEVYSGAERLTDVQTPTFFGLYSKVIAVGSMSKAYGMPGVRIGWAVGPREVVNDIWARHEYTTISTTMLSNKLAALALAPEVRPKLLERTRGYIRHGYPILKSWMDSHADLFSMIEPDAAAIAFVRYFFNMNSTQFTDRLREEKSTLIVPGDHFGIDNFLRISFGLPEEYLISGLERIRELALEI